MQQPHPISCCKDVPQMCCEAREIMCSVGTFVLEPLHSGRQSSANPLENRIVRHAVMTNIHLPVNLMSNNNNSPVILGFHCVMTDNKLEIDTDFYFGTLNVF
ncbi:hypothetical protein TNCV_3399341 [Trichonephila clavipes]|nr:hypothetical protein TNCV_3399341 [Trichonephila clavipes]